MDQLPTITGDGGRGREATPISDITGIIGIAERVVQKTYGDTVSVWQKGKTLNKFGRNDSVGTSYETVAEFQGSEINETFVTTNIIDAIVSSSTSDTLKTVTIEGHTIDGSGNLTFVKQNAALNGRTPVALAVPLARATRAYLAPSGVFSTPVLPIVGDVAIYDDTAGVTAGVPNTDAATKLLLKGTLGRSKSEKASTAISSTDYWFITYFDAAIDDPAGPTNFIELRMETRDVANGGVWLPMLHEFVIWAGQDFTPREFDPPLIVPKNHDWRIVAECDGGSSSVYAEAGGYLAEILT